MTQEAQKKRKFWHTGITAHSSRVALSPARALTSHLRERYHGKYQGKYRLAKAVFAFDLFLAALALGLLIFVVVILFQSSYFKNSGLDMVFSAGKLKASDTVPFSITIRATDNKVHHDVNLRWKLPEWVEILRSEPKLSAEGSVFFGTLRPGEEKTSTIFTRLRGSQGAEVPVVFGLHQFDALGFFGELTGYETRKIEESSLTALPAVRARYFTRGALLPILISNKSDLTAEAVTLELLSEPGLSRATFVGAPSSAADAQIVVLGDLEPGKKKVAYVVLPSDQDIVRLKWNLLERSHVVYQNYIRYDLATSTAVWSDKDVSLETSGAKLVLRNPAKRFGEVFVDHPGLAERNFMTMALNPNSAAESVILEYDAVTSSDAWEAIMVEAANGGIIGPAQGGYLNQTLALKTSVRYYTNLGDQIGIGSLPPQVGATTTFWVVWDFGILKNGLTDVHLETVLPEGVKATGRYSSEFGGDFSMQDKTVSWVLPQGLPASPGAPIKLGFEISFCPTPDMLGKVVPLVGQTKASGQDRLFGSELSSKNIPGDDTRLEFDMRAKNSGIIQPP